ncbi:hypothetical protein SE17_27755 [Kouleothrix aurantiaca]|uniref:Uncharacterized protein n=1 Tax=Kouleothrix aurantiaca TaxID=186479 RepID=A0A0P9CWA1_9CHLR|nr:hypothetical protein SE17_27755 [Kouleothrix aurantiaca]
MTVRTDRPAAGRPLDLALAQAMGWQIVVSPDGAVWTTGPSDAPIVAPDGPLVALPAWSTDEAAAWRLAADLRTRTGYEISLYSPDGSRTAWGAGVGRRGYWIEEIGTTRAEALCRALLLYYAFGMPAAAWRLKLAVTALQAAVRALFGLAVVVTVVNPVSPAWLRAVAVLGWVAHVVALVMSDSDPAAEGMDERTPPAGEALHLVLISPFGMLLLGAIAGLIMAVVQAMMHLVP